MFLYFIHWIRKSKNCFDKNIMRFFRNGKCLLVISACLFGTIPIFGKMLSQSGVHPLSIVLFTQLNIAGICFLLCKLLHISLKIGSKSTRNQLIAGGLLGSGGTNLLLNLSYMCIPVATTTIIHFCYPIFVALVMQMVWHQEISRLKKCAYIMCLLGVILMSGFNKSINFQGVILALLSAFTYAGYLILYEKGSIAHLSCFCRMTYMSAGAAMGCALIFIFNRTWFTPLLSFHCIFPLLLFSCCSMGAHIFLGLGVRLEGATDAALLTFLEPVVATILAHFVYDEQITIATIVGMCSIFLLQIVSVLSEKNNLSTKHNYKAL